MAPQFKHQFECLEAIANALADVIDEPWDDVRVDAERHNDVHMTIVDYYQPSAGGRRKDDIPVIPRLSFWFFELAELVSTKEKGLYKKCAFTLTKDGEYKAEYEY